MERTKKRAYATLPVRRAAEHNTQVIAALLAILLLTAAFLASCTDPDDASSAGSLDSEGERSSAPELSSETSVEESASHDEPSEGVESPSEDDPSRDESSDVSDPSSDVTSEESIPGDESSSEEPSEPSGEEPSGGTSDSSSDSSEPSEDSNSPAHTHEWEEATCTSAKTCLSCGKTEGSAKGHDWKAATCTVAKTCKVCGKTEGTANGHDYSRGTCTACGAKDPDYKEAAVYGDTPVVIEVNGTEYSLTSYADAEAVLPLKTEEDFVSPEKGFKIYVKSGAVMAGTTYTANGDGTYTTTRGQTMSDNRVTNVFRNFWCKTCGARKGNGTHGTCVRYLHDDECDECGAAVEGMKCHTCEEN